MTPPPPPIAAYIAEFPPEVQVLLQAVRRTIRTVLPQAEERISYGIPTFWQGRNLIHFAAFSRHIGVYPGAAAMAAFREELAPWKLGRGSVQFPFKEPLPLALIQRIAVWCVEHHAKPVSASPARQGRANAAAAPGRTRRRPA